MSTDILPLEYFLTKQKVKNKMRLNAEVKTAKVTQSGNEELGMKEKNLYFLVIETPKGRLQINVGEKTHDTVKELTDVVTNIQIDEPLKSELDKTINKIKKGGI